MQCTGFQRAHNLRVIFIQFLLVTQCNVPRCNQSSQGLSIGSKRFSACPGGYREQGKYRAAMAVFKKSKTYNNKSFLDQIYSCIYIFILCQYFCVGSPENCDHDPICSIHQLAASLAKMQNIKNINDHPHQHHCHRHHQVIVIIIITLG